ncbi:anti-sigma-F factor Fin [Peribacillus sp. SCS-26]|uniref:anti-sigma-F factor Fin n=1 Tax=Paraperibacillus marinus TaxID=3115295 RepID=UPI003906AB8B
MAFHYKCRHCSTSMGTIDEILIDSERLGFHALTSQERQEMIQTAENGDYHVQSICEDCQEALERNPGMHQQDYLIQ